MTDAWAGRTFTNAPPLKLDGVQRRFVEAMSEPGTTVRFLTNGGVTLGRDDFETEDEWRAFLGRFGLSGLAPGCRIHVRPSGDEVISDDDTDPTSIKIAWHRGFPTVSDR
ncbi:hypothetical protein [Methylobacterium sp. Leaf88]|uniref:hypothetical protein n=1 Tax=Methylobacterium sp. Leaf88 TaxID=1736244 RepID=UPI0006FC20DC|nr:hypothetical protein [Methylobacterium sp. Leaf88]KQO61742.1 hypothetical protein ASF20_09740 [Methylobacterium sp. Leaf88]